VRVVAYRIQVSRWRRVTAGFKAHRRRGAAQDVPELSVDHVAIVTALKEIPAAQRRAIVLYHLVGPSIGEIAQETGVAEGTVKSRLSRARGRLASLLSDSEGGFGAEAGAHPDEPRLFAKEGSPRA
jgi:RNA polymerase sigma-70 factor, ECF subfamily